MTVPTKRIFLVLAPPLILGLLVSVWVIPWLANRESPDLAWTVLTWTSALIWGVTLWWALHHMVFQLVALIRGDTDPDLSTPPAAVRVAVFYATRDDFIPECCESCVRQQYPADAFRVVICDDSETASYREAIDKFRAERPSVAVCRRADRAGHKAGNLNHAFAVEGAGKCDWVVIVDADQWLGESFLAELAPVLAAQPPAVAFVQAGRNPPPEGKPATPFQQALKAEVHLFFERDMAGRARFGFLPFLGHGGAVRASIWQHVGGFPPVVSEDFAFGMEVRKHKLWGQRAEHVRSAEAYPPDFGAFVVRLGKFAAGAGELWFRRLPAFLVRGATVTEWWDASLLLAGYALMPLVLANLVISAYLCHVLWTDAVAVLPSGLPYLFVAMFLVSLAILLSVTPSVGQAIRHWFWGLAVYGAAMPVAAWRFTRSLFVRPRFQRTPKVAGTAPRLRLTGPLICAGGVAGLVLAYLWWSPFSPILAATAGAQALFPVFRWLHEDATLRGRIARCLVYLPGASFVVGLVWMWYWATT